MKELSPNCPFSFCKNFEEKIRTSFLQRILGKFIGRIFNKPEKGIILMENMSIESSTISTHDLMKGRDKRQIMGIDEAKGAMVAMAIFHGVMWNFYNGHCLPTLENREQTMTISREDIISYLDPLSPPSRIEKWLSKDMHSRLAKYTFKAIKLMIENFFPDQNTFAPKLTAMHQPNTKLFSVNSMTKPKHILEYAIMTWMEEIFW